MKKFMAALGAVCLCWLACPAAAQAAYYITAAGETPESVAAATATDLELLLAGNDLDCGDALPAGRLLTLPVLPLGSYTVQSGDTVAALCRACDIEPELLRALNSINGSNLIYVGQQLLVPLSGELAACSAPVSDTDALLAARGGSGWLWPAGGVISSRFGPRGGGFHYGLDVAADSGTPLTASRGGLVAEAGWKNDAYGWTVMLSHGNGTQTLYAHCQELLVQAGDRVEQGQNIALMGSTGHSTGPHVHFELRVAGECVDPLLYLK